jgi:hypothetical protein
MKIYVGETIKNAVNDPNQPIPKTKIADMVGVVRQHLHQMLNNPEMEIDYIVKIGLAIRRDFSADFPELRNYPGINALNDPEVPYNVRTPMTIEMELIDLQRKYIQVLQDNNDLLKELRAAAKEKK